MPSGPWRTLAEQFQVICPPGGAPGAGSPGALGRKMTCGHWVSAAGLRGWVRALLDQGITSFRCPRCPDTPWLWQELCKLGLFSDEDRATLEAQILAQDGARGSYRQCPRCQHLVQRLDPGTLRTPCLPCSQRAGALYCFCWGCRTEWRDPSSHADSRCPLQAALHDAPKIHAPRSSVHSCPSLRACPHCHALLSHTTQGCPMVVCPECRCWFCYRCLGLSGGHLRSCPIADPQLVCGSGDAVTPTSRGSRGVPGIMGLILGLWGGWI
ncbi:E3 ubiquitin-protein ligase RNF19B-like isoform X1 [Chrysemys picta bellii]|uniref:E3 ubiquitin-protein ligase RNF19B-like isoform X1 n=1 Tax=Chrysemys picta bellii TaxID=8478 RepID=UPI0032B158F8